jgi:hypothetical protein
MVSNVVKLSKPDLTDNKLGQPGASSLSDQDLIKIAVGYRTEAENSRYRTSRMQLNKRNRDAFMNVQDWSMKAEGMSTEFLPETTNTIEQFAAFLKKGLIQFGDWFALELPKGSPISNESARQLLMFYLDNMPKNALETVSFSEVFSDAIKVALLEAEMVFKTHGVRMPQRHFVAEGDKLKTVELTPWRLTVDLVRNEAYWRDETGRGLYKIHRVVRDLHEVKAMAKAGIYDQAAVDKIIGDYPDSNLNDRERNNNPVVSGRKRVVIDELHGTLVDAKGEAVFTNVIMSIANDKHVIRKPQENDAWHGESPFDEIALLRVPYGLEKKALYDQVVPLNFALNEMFNLILDGSLASVWGIKQLRVNGLADPSQVEGGIPQGTTLVVTDELPAGEKVLENVTEGEVPGEALAVFNVLSRMTRSAALQNDITTGNLPSRQVKATEVVEAGASQSVMMDAFVSNVELQLAKVLKKAWLTICQNADDLNAAVVNEAMTSAELFRFARMSPAQRYATMGNAAVIKVTGLSATIMRAREFQRIMAMLQLATTNPIIAKEALKRFSPSKVVTKLMKILNLNPKDYEPSEEELKDVDNHVRKLWEQGGMQASARPTGEPGESPEIRQEMSPSNEA